MERQLLGRTGLMPRALEKDAGLVWPNASPAAATYHAIEARRLQVTTKSVRAAARLIAHSRLKHRRLRLQLKLSGSIVAVTEYWHLIEAWAYADEVSITHHDHRA